MNFSRGSLSLSLSLSLSQFQTIFLYDIIIFKQLNLDFNSLLLVKNFISFFFFYYDNRDISFKQKYNNINYKIIQLPNYPIAL